MKKLILATLILTVSSQLFSQIKLSKDFDFSLSTPYDVIDAGIKTYYGKDGEILSVKVDGGTVFIQKYQKNTLNQTSSKVYEDFEKGFVTENIYNFANKYYLFYSAWDKGNKTEQLFVREIDFEKGDFIGKSKRIIAVNGKVTGGDGNKFSVEPSFNEKHLMIYYREKPESRNDKVNKDEIGFYMFDENMEVEWKKTAKMPYTESQMNNIAYAVNQNGSAFILSEVLPSGEKDRLNKQDLPNYKLELLVVSESGVEINGAEIKLKNKIVNQVSFFEGKDNDLILAGFYGNKGSKGTDGIFMVKLTDKGELNDEVTFEIPTELMKENMSDRAQKKMDKKEDKGIDLSMSNMELRDLVFNKDGSLIMIGEKYYTITTYTTSSSGMTSSKTTHYYEEMLISKINANGTLAWMKKLPKKQTRSSSGGGLLFSIGYSSHGLGYKYIQGKSSHYLLFLDNVKNLELASNESPKPHSDGQGGFLTAYKINDANGTVEKLSIIDTRDAKGTELFQFAPSRIVKVSDSVFGVECYKKKKEDVMVKITLKD